LYVTTTVRLEPDIVVALAVAFTLRDTGDVTVNDTWFVGCGVAAAVGGNVAACVGETVRWAVGVAGAGEALVDAAVAVGVADQE
jgi:hypothetical protein